MSVSLTWGQVLRWRLLRQGLDAPPSEDGLAGGARRLCGVHAQILSSAELALAVRSPAVRPGDVAKGLWERRSLVRSWAMRGTLHVFGADDYPAVVAALRAGQGFNDGLLRVVGVTRDEMEAVTEAVREALDGRCLTRTELAEEIRRLTRSRRLGDLVRESWGDFLKPAAFRGYLCAGPSRGRHTTFVRPDQWLEGWRLPEPEDPLGDVFRRYLRVYGPATRDDFARWWGTHPRVVRALLDRLDRELEEVDVEGHRAWMLREDVPSVAGLEPSPSVHLVPAFDVYVVSAFRQWEQVLVDPDAKLRVYRPQGWVSPVVLVGGRIAGVWKHDARAKRVRVEVEPFRALPRSARSGLRAAAERVAEFFGAPLELAAG